jgi:protein-S-isoprenylcysteine O-methyltransferase Ste14
MDEVRRIALPAAALVFFALAMVVPAVRVQRRTGVWPIVVGSSGAPHQRLLAWLMRLFGVALVIWMVVHVAAGPRAVGVVTPPAAVEAAGWALMLLALALVVTAQTQMGAAWRVGIDEKATPLITHGLYRVVRNPIYSAMGVLCLGAVLVAPSVWSVAGAVGIMVALALQTRLEERHLIRVHGPRYLAWAARTGRFVPGIGCRLPTVERGADDNRRRRRDD